MKFITVIASLLMALTSQAVSLYHGPYLYKEIGKNTCSVKPGHVTLIQNEVKTTYAISLDYNEMKKAIFSAHAAPMKKVGVHVRATNPPVKIGAGVSPDLFSFDLYVDGSSISRRQGQDALDLIRLVNKYCKDLKK